MITVCDIHPGVITDEYVPCPVCQRTDSNIVMLMRQTLEINKRLDKLEGVIAQLSCDSGSVKTVRFPSPD